MQAFSDLSSNSRIQGCIGCLDGWLCELQAPSGTDKLATGPSRYFSGHCFKHGINVKAVRVSTSRFIYVNCDSPGGVNDCRAYRRSQLPATVESLESGLFIAADNAYMSPEHLLTPYNALQTTDSFRNSFNYSLSQLRIRVEMAFSMLANKWGVFKRPLQNELDYCTSLIHCAFSLHNYCISER